MKKILLLCFLSAISFPSFSSVVAGAEKIIEDFWNKGTYIKIVDNSNNIRYLSKTSVSGIHVDENDYTILFMGFDEWYQSNGSCITCNIKRWSVSSDENCNIIITRK